MKFIVFEGLDGAGKSTLIQKVQESLLQKQLVVRLVRDPGTTTLGEKLRNLILDPQMSPSSRAEILMYQAARAQLVGENIRPSLQRGEWVLSDRFYSSTIAFQCFARGLSRADVDWLNNYACEGLQPDLVIFIDIPVEESENRVAKRVSATGVLKDRLEKETRSFHQRVREGYLQQARENPSTWLVLDGLKTAENLFLDVIAFLEKKQWLG